MYCKYEDMYYSWLVDLWIIVEPNLFIDKYYIEIVECLALLGKHTTLTRIFQSLLDESILANSSYLLVDISVTVSLCAIVKNWIVNFSSELVCLWTASVLNI